MAESTHISADDVRHVAKLSRLKLSDEQIAHFTEQLQDVMGHIDKLSELNVEHVEPMAHPMDQTDVLGEDEPRDGLPIEAVLRNAPQQSRPFFRVPKVLGEGSGA